MLLPIIVTVITIRTTIMLSVLCLALLQYWLENRMYRIRLIPDHIILMGVGSLKKKTALKLKVIIIIIIIMLPVDG